jgi:acetyl esterase/lipase
LKLAARAWAAGDDLNEPLLSPINGPLADLPPISLHISTRDLLLPDARRFRSLAKEQGAVLRYFEYEELMHDWILFNLPESHHAINEVIAFIRA